LPFSFWSQFIRSSVPSKIEKQANGKLKVTWVGSKGGEGGSDEFDTVLVAVGRFADTKSLGLEKAGVVTDKKGKIPCSNEQTNVPHIYAIGYSTHCTATCTRTVTHTALALPPAPPSLQ
jgi:thioredoxin reductase (NADPH)